VLLRTFECVSWGDWEMFVRLRRFAKEGRGVLVFLLRNQVTYLGAVVPIIAGCGLLWFSRSHGFAFDVEFSMAVILAGMINLRLPWGRWPFRWIVAMGDASYSIYLIHYGMIVIFAETVDYYRAQAIYYPNVTLALLSMTILATGILVHLTIERPLLASARRWIRL